MENTTRQPSDLVPLDCEVMPPEHGELEPMEVENPLVVQIRQLIVARVIQIFRPAGVPEVIIVPYALEVANDLERDLDKFATGQREHGGNLLDRDIIADIEPEIRDLSIYIRALRMQRKFMRLAYVEPK